MNAPIATKQGSVPPAATKLDECFWCHNKLGTPHAIGCAAVVRRAKVRAIIEYEIDIHGGGDPQAPDRFEFMRNEGSWCSSNMLNELEVIADRAGCLCGCTRFAFVSWVSDELRESK